MIIWIAINKDQLGIGLYTMQYSLTCSALLFLVSNTTVDCCILIVISSIKLNLAAL